MLIELYPSRPWKPGALILPPWSENGKIHVAPAWQLGEQAGVLSAPQADSHWSIEWDATHPVHTTPHGVIEAAGDSKAPINFCAFCPEPGILVGEASASHAPNLHTTAGHVTDREDGEELETADSLVRLYSYDNNGRIFFVVIILRDQADDPAAILSRFLNFDPTSALRTALAPYQAFAQRQTGLPPDDTNRLEAHIFSLICNLRTSRDGTRVFGASDDTGQFSTKQIYELVIAWIEVRPEVARAAMRTLLELQQPDGALPRALDALGSPSIESLYIPILAHCFDLLWRRDPQRDWFDFAAPRAQRHVEFIINALDPDRAGRPLWPSENDALAPTLFDPDLFTPDLPALLACEITALEKIADAVAIRSLDLTDLLRYRDLLLAQMREALWIPEKASFTEVYPDDRPLMRQTINTLIPLVCTELSHSETTALTNLLFSRQHFLGSGGIMAWVPWGGTEVSPPIWPAHQLLLLEALEMRNAVTEAATLRGILLGNAPEGNSPGWDAVAIHLLAVPSDSRLNTRVFSPMLHWLNHHRRATLISAIALFALLNGLVFLYSCHRAALLTPQTIETTAGLARRYYQEQKFEAAEELLGRIIASKQAYPSANLEMGNIQYRLGKWDEAERFYKMPSQTPLIEAQMLHNLATLLYERGRTNEAITTWKRVLNEFAVPAPAVAKRARTALTLLGEITPEVQ